MEPVETTQPTAGDKMHEASEVVSAKAGEAVDSGRGLVADQIGQRSTQLSDQIASASETMRRVAEQARTEGNSQHARLADQAADRGERVKNYLDEVEPEQLGLHACQSVVWVERSKRFAGPVGRPDPRLLAARDATDRGRAAR